MLRGRDMKGNSSCIFIRIFITIVLQICFIAGQYSCEMSLKGPELLEVEYYLDAAIAAAEVGHKFMLFPFFARR
jgi:hypothetical protein